MRPDPKPDHYDENNNKKDYSFGGDQGSEGRLPIVRDDLTEKFHRDADQRPHQSLNEINNNLTHVNLSFGTPIR